MSCASASLSGIGSYSFASVLERLNELIVLGYEPAEQEPFAHRSDDAVVAIDHGSAAEDEADLAFPIKLTAALGAAAPVSPS